MGLFDEVTAQDMLAEAKRELAMRRSVYPRRVAAGKLRVEDAGRQIQVMEEIVRHFEESLRR